jgi:diguanylate cyclase (GGDEF)-like protein
MSVAWPFAEPHNSGRTLVAITAVALALFVGLAGRVIAGSPANNGTLLTALFLNVALILLAWRKHSDLLAEVHSRSEAEARAALLAARDPLTGLLNRHTFAEETGALLGAASQRGQAVAMLVVDLDQLKTVNDTYGHAVGDALLVAIGSVLRAELPGTALRARLGADGFGCALAFDPARPGMVEMLVERLIAALSQPLDLPDQRLLVFAAIGLSRSDRDGASADALMRSAEIAMCTARGTGRGYAWFEAAMEQAVRRRAALVEGLRTAVANGDVVPYFEKQIDLATGRIVGFEVLARWDSPELGTVSPDVFVPLAEETGLIGELSLCVMRQAFAAARDWDGAITLAVNISPHQLRDPWLAQKVIKTLTETGFPAARLEIEVTESALVDNLPLAQSIVGSLKNQGVRVALDDFGTGYSSLAHLRALPFDRIKIDRSFVASLTEKPDSAAIVTAIIGLGETLNLAVTAEGIEDEASAARLAVQGCSRGQGYLYGRPMPLAEVRALLAGVPGGEGAVGLRRAL